MIPLVYNPNHLQHLEISHGATFEHVIGQSYDTSIGTLTPVSDNLPEDNFYFILDINNVNDRLDREIDVPGSGSFRALRDFPVPPAVLSRIKNKTAKFLLVRPYHGYSRTVMTLIANLIIDLYREYCFTFNDFVFMLPAAGRKNTPDLQIIDHTYFENATAEEYLSTPDKRADLKKHVTKKHKFYCTNRRVTPDRLAVVTELFDFRQQGILTCLQTVDSEMEKVFAKMYPEYIDKYTTVVKSALPLTWDKTINDSINECIFTKNSEFVNDMLNCHLSVINETQSITCSYLPQWHSEKIFKAIAFAQPFVLIGQHGSLAALRNQGYRTFSPWINESYDAIADDRQRVLAAAHEARRIVAMPDSALAAWSEGLRETALYNQDLLFNRFRTHRERIELELKEFLTTKNR